MSCSTATPNNKLELALDEQDVAMEQRTPSCATPKGYRAIALEIKPTTWKADLSKCNVCEVRFTWLNHRHKCRKCSEAVCNSCSKDRKVLRARTAPKRVCDRCIQSCWTPRNTATTIPSKPTVADTTAKPAGMDGRRVSLTVSASDANACPVVATATAPLSPGTPAAAGFFDLGCATPSAIAAPAPTPVGQEAAGGDTIKNSSSSSSSSSSSNGDDNRPPSSSSSRCRHRRQVSVAMLPPPPLASPAASASASPMRIMTLPPPTPTAGGGDAENEGAEAVPPSAAGSPSSPSSPPAPFFGGRRQGARGGRRESSSGRLESRVWGGGRALGGGGEVDKVVAVLRQLQEAEKLETEEEGQQTEVASSAPAAALLPALPEESAATAAAADAPAADAANAVEQEHGDEDDYGAGGPMMLKIPAWSGVAMSGVAVGTGVVVAVLLRSAFSLVFFY